MTLNIPPSWQHDPASGAAERPNVIWLFSDQQRACSLGCYGDPNVRTPNLDNLAASGLTCTGAVAGFPLCCPFRGSLLTGLYPHRAVPGHEYALPPGLPTIADAFNANGYHTAWIGKWHLDGFKERSGRAAFHIVPPDRRGRFQHWCGYENNNSQWDTWVHGGAGKDAYHERLDGWETDALTDRLIRHIEERAQAGTPFFAALSVQPPHDPLVAPERWRRHNPQDLRLRPNVPPGTGIEAAARRDLCGYYGMVENLDWNVGRVFAALNRLGIMHRTVVMYFSDHGDMLGSHGLDRKVVPYEESLRIPFLMGNLNTYDQYYRARRRRVADLVNHVDITATTLGLCGIARPEGMQGTDYSRVWRGEAPAPDSAYLQSVVPTLHGQLPDQPWRGLVTTDGWKYACFPGQHWLLFNLNEDPYEMANLAHVCMWRQRRGELLDRLRQWAKETGDDFEFPAD